MIEYVKKADVLEIINSPLPRDLTAEYIYDLKGVWLDEDEADTPQTNVPRCSVNGTPYDECGFCEYFNCDTCQCEADTPQTEMPEYAEWKDAYNKMTDCDRYVITNDEGDKAYNCIGCTQTDCSWK